MRGESSTETGAKMTFPVNLLYGESDEAWEAVKGDVEVGL